MSKMWVAVSITAGMIMVLCVIGLVLMTMSGMSKPVRPAGGASASTAADLTDVSPTPSAVPDDPAKPRRAERTVDPGEVYFDNCEQVRQVYPFGVLRGMPGYRSGLDSDKDGTACEPTRD